MVTLTHVKVVRRTEASLRCRIGEAEYWIPMYELRDGTTVGREGDVGVLVVDEQFALERALAPNRIY